MPSNLNVVEIKAFVPAKDFELSKRFYVDIGFTMASDGGGVAYFHHGAAALLLMDCCDPGMETLHMHLLVEDVDAWWARLQASNIAGRYGVAIGSIVQQPWRMRDFTLSDPSGVSWRIAMNTD